jgi:very-short-patch-repair endonuclease
LIEHELNKKKRHIPIRQLVRRASHALQALKPCFMMSPLSVAQYLAPGQIEFDLLIMDEASQVRPEDALGAIARSQQIVIVGDPKQLPPTQFFERLVNEEDEDTATVFDGQESILDICLSTYEKGRLRWHYRSEHESLIAFSNHHFYDDDLIVFPAPRAGPGAGPGYGVHLNYVENATYLKGRNLKEAEAVAAAVREHFRNTPDLSLGVATFNSKQQELIAGVLDKLCEEYRWLDGQIKATEEMAEPFFIKNLENVQGDERDVILVSTTYGPDPNTGRVFQRFGPISRDMGWRRLNVIFSRAKKRLKMYLEYAETGYDGTSVIGSDRAEKSDFEIAVSKIIQERGYQTVPQVGVAGFRIDIGVCDPERRGEYILGIEYDGASYHSAKSVRDRDRLKPEILEKKGWKIHRIWSVDWFKNRDAEVERLLHALSCTTKLSFEDRHSQTEFGNEEKL